MANRYNMATVLALLAVAPRPVDIVRVRQTILEGSDVPIDRVEACAAETIQLMPMLDQVVALVRAAGDEPTARVMEAVCGESMWVDDDKKEVSIDTHVLDEDGNEIASGSAKGRLD